MSAKNVDRNNRFRSITVGFRVSPEEQERRFLKKWAEVMRCREIIISLASHCPKKNRNQ